MQLISILSMMFASLAYLIPSLFIFVAVCLSLFLYFDVIASCKRFKCSSKVRRYIFDVLSAAVNVLFDDCLEFYYLLYYLCFTNFVKSSSNQTDCFACGGNFVCGRFSLICNFHKKYGFSS